MQTRRVFTLEASGGAVVGTVHSGTHTDQSRLGDNSDWSNSTRCTVRKCQFGTHLHYSHDPGKVNILAVLFSAIFLLLVLHEYLRLACVSIVDTAVSGLSTTLYLSNLVLGEACNWVSQWPSCGCCLNVVAMERRGELHVVNGWATHVCP